MRYSSIRPRSVMLRASSGPATSISPSSSALSPRITPLTSCSTSVALGPTDFNERDTTHFGWPRHAAANLRSSALHSARSSSQYRITSYIRRPYTRPARRLELSDLCPRSHSHDSDSLTPRRVVAFDRSSATASVRGATPACTPRRLLGSALPESPGRDDRAPAHQRP